MNWKREVSLKAVALALGAAATALTSATAMAQRQKQQEQQQQRLAETPAPAGAGGPGRYALLREENKDSGCLVNLQQSGRAQLGPGCMDQGLVVFDPTGWSSGRNSLILRGRKGHRVTFMYRPDGTWLRDPPDKRPLALRKY
jgi:hypothetical protein